MTNAVPEESPAQLMFVTSTAFMVVVRALGSVTVAQAVAVQALASVTVTQ